MKSLKGAAIVLLLIFALIAPTVSADENDSGFSARVEMRLNDNLSVDFRVRDHENAEVLVNGVSVENVHMMEAVIDGSISIEEKEGVLVGRILVEDRDTLENLKIQISSCDGTVTSTVFGGSGAVENYENFGKRFENFPPENYKNWDKRLENFENNSTYSNEAQNSTKSADTGRDGSRNEYPSKNYVVLGVILAAAVAGLTGMWLRRKRHFSSREDSQASKSDPSGRVRRDSGGEEN